MIPVKLSLRNFMPYRDSVPPLYFNDIHTASIWGDNGNGKSSLIDAITWALWGKTRAKSDDDIIHLGQDETEVEFDFTVGDNFYRVIRKHAKPKRRRASGQSLLDFQVSSGNGFRSISGNTITQTQQEIIDVLHMDYSTFINSAYLRQGHADEFTQQQPVKRKEVLSSILGLSRYDKLEDQAKELARNQEMQRTLAENAIRDIGEELAHKPEYEAELEKEQAELSAIDKTVLEKEKSLSELRQRKELLENKKQQADRIDRHMAESARTKELLENQMKQFNTRIQEYEGLIARRGALEEGYGQYTDVKKQNEDLDRKLRLVTALNERKYKLEMSVVRSSQALLNDHSLAENNVAKLGEEYRKLPELRNELVQAQNELKKLAGDEEEMQKKSGSVKKLQTEIYDLQSSKTRLDQEIAEITEKLDLLSSQTGVKCPLCERDLGEEHRELIEKKYVQEKQDKSQISLEMVEGISLKTSEFKISEDEISRLTLILEQARTAAQSKINLLHRDIQETEKTGSQLEEERNRLAEIEERISAKEYAVEDQESLKKVEEELAGLDYDPEKHEQVRKTVNDLVQYEELKRKLDEALNNIDSEKDSSAKAEATIIDLTRSIEEDMNGKDELAEELELLPGLNNEQVAAENEYRDLSLKQKQVQESIGRIKGILQRSAQLEERAKDKEKELDQALTEEQIYRDLARAFGKRGIQAWLIEIALPEIEVETNKLLGRMTDNRMSVKIETQRETKKGDTVETLDIKIADELGTRNYEMFSGGEAFRIDFAIRIALSKLLARRAGAPLPTLIIDEGFGTQDSNGLEKLKEAIISIQDDFEKILVVTHIEELRDAFPTRIDIVKTAEGSTIQVN
ncbi:MAG: SMC family ATPase [Dehalococcoidales bacterium]|nr:MAG: SMC family ATPase [Dehalococcoidales bacterium]